MSGVTRIARLFVYPVKSSAAVALLEARVAPRGLAGDRRWLVTDESGDFLTGREFPQLVRILATPRGDTLELRAPGMPPIEAAPPDFNGRRQTVEIWNDRCAALPAGTAVNDWLSEYLGVRCRLVHMDAECLRTIGGGEAEGELSFADNYPLLVISCASLDDLNARLTETMDMRRFRPNMIVTGTDAYAEDVWKRIRIGEVVLAAAGRCDRCAFTTIDPETAERHPQQEPLRTLSTYRRGEDGGVYFGRNFAAERFGHVRVGDEVEIID